MNTQILSSTIYGCAAGTASALHDPRVMSDSANDNQGDRHEVALPDHPSQWRQRFPQKAAAVLVEVCIALVLVASVYALFAFALAMEG